jgi:hypothetical protein
MTVHVSVRSISAFPAPDTFGLHPAAEPRRGQ